MLGVNLIPESPNRADDEIIANGDWNEPEFDVKGRVKWWNDEKVWVSSQ
jgi:hypothetical protein